MDVEARPLARGSVVVDELPHSAYGNLVAAESYRVYMHMQGLETRRDEHALGVRACRSS